MRATKAESETMSESAKPVRHRHDHLIVCPWCRYGHGDAWEWAKDMPSEMRCDGCGKMFTVYAEYSVEYISYVTGLEKP